MLHLNNSIPALKHFIMESYKFILQMNLVKSELNGVMILIKISKYLIYKE